MTTYGLTSWFLHPSLGMTTHEILSRASCFLLPSPLSSSSSSSSPPLILTSQHVIRPFHFPKYYPEDWVTALKQDHIKTFLEERSPSGSILKKIELINPLHHDTRDISILEFKDDSESQDLEVFKLPETFIWADGKVVGCHGHILQNPSEHAAAAMTLNKSLETLSNATTQHQQKFQQQEPEGEIKEGEGEKLR